MIEFIAAIVFGVLLIKIIKAGNSEENTKYSEVPDNVVMTYEEWEALEDTDKPLSATKKEWSEIEKGEKLTKDEYETQRAAFMSSCLE